jgi:hypothetical protein
VATELKRANGQAAVEERARSGRSWLIRSTIFRCERPRLVDPLLSFLSPWLRISLVIRQIRSTTWDSATWPTVKETLRNSLRLQARMRRWAWWN